MNSRPYWLLMLLSPRLETNPLPPIIFNKNHEFNFVFLPTISNTVFITHVLPRVVSCSCYWRWRRMWRIEGWRVTVRPSWRLPAGVVSTLSSCSLVTEQTSMHNRQPVGFCWHFSLLQITNNKTFFFVWMKSLVRLILYSQMYLSFWRELSVN